MLNIIEQHFDILMVGNDIRCTGEAIGLGKTLHSGDDIYYFVNRRMAYYAVALPSAGSGISMKLFSAVMAALLSRAEIKRQRLSSNSPSNTYYIK